MTKTVRKSARQHVIDYLGRVLEDRTVGEPLAPGAVAQPKGAGHLIPTYWADAPWRLEPNCDTIPFSFVVRDGAGAGVHLDEIVVLEAPDDGQPWAEKPWEEVHCYTQGLGDIDRRLWAYRPPGSPPGAPPSLPLPAFKTAERGRRLLLTVVFRGRCGPAGLGVPVDAVRPLAIELAAEPLPMRGSPQWYYGDTHYHSSYTNDVKEFGNPIADTRAAAVAIGLDWLVVTDHSVDLAENNPYWEPLHAATPWDDLGHELQHLSDDRLRLLRGEEVTVLGIPGKGDNTLHMLVLGPTLDKLIPGAFARKNLLSAVVKALPGCAVDLFKHLFGPIYQLEAVLTGVNRKGNVEPKLVGRSVQAQGALAFAAHPAAIAQAPGGVWEFHDLAQPIHGMEAWNGTMRFQTGKEENPFEQWQPAEPWHEGASAEGIEVWDRMLRYKAAQADPRFVLLAGSDAHGSFNWSEGWWVDWNGFRADDNALGKARTLLYLPHRNPAGPRRAPTESEIATALRSASCVVTDGPVLNFTVTCGGERAELGQILPADGSSGVEVDVQAASSDEFGPVEWLDVRYYFAGMSDTACARIRWAPGTTKVLAQGLPAGPGYIRLATATDRGGTTYRCFTNPIWLRFAEPTPRSLSVVCHGGQYLGKLIWICEVGIASSLRSSQ
ncbi:MAG TPA: hypothetical protein VLC95_19355 [Anaerolineae bacterium]|nr:hypothetical protein [Anaerolineae bacterium]